MSLSKAQIALVDEAYRLKPEPIDLYRTQWKTARVLERRLLGEILRGGRFILYDHTIQLIKLGRAMK